MAMLGAGINSAAQKITKRNNMYSLVVARMRRLGSHSDHRRPQDSFVEGISRLKFAHDSSVGVIGRFDARNRMMKMRIEFPPDRLDLAKPLL